MFFCSKKIITHKLKLRLFVVLYIIWGGALKNLPKPNFPSFFNYFECDPKMVVAFYCFVDTCCVRSTTTTIQTEMDEPVQQQQKIQRSISPLSDVSVCVLAFRKGIVIYQYTDTQHNRISKCVTL